MLNLDITSIFKNIFVSLVENSWPVFLIMLVFGILIYLYRYDFSDTYRKCKRKKHTEIALKMIIIPIVLLLSYLFFTQSYWILLFLTLGIIYYVLDSLGLIPMFISLRKDYY